MSSIFDWSLTAANNASADSLINWAEGQAPSTVNGSAREMMARVAEYLGDNGGALTAGGTANALTVTANSAFTAYANGLVLALRIATDNSAAATLNVNGLGAKAIQKMVAAGESALTGGELQATGIYILMYQSALNSAAGAWLVLNPTPADQSSYVTLTGSQTVTNKLFTTGNAFNGTLGATTPAAVAGTTGTFSGAVSGTTGTFSGAVSGTTGTFSGAISGTSGTFSGVLTGAQDIKSSTTVVTLNTTGAGTIFLRPNGAGVSTGQVQVASTGAVTINGTLTVTG